jgi:uncharacterized protein YxjI
MAARDPRTLKDNTVFEVLNRNLFFIREEPGLLRPANNCDILDPETGRVIMECREQDLKGIRLFLRFSEMKRTTPFDIRVRTPDGQPVLSVRRGVPIVVSMVRVFDEDDVLLGGFRQKLFSVSGAFDVLDAADQPVCRIKGGFSGWNFAFLGPDDVELAHVTKKWAGLGKELFTSADDYVLQIDEVVPRDSAIRQLILASVICISLIVKISVP